MDLKVGQTYKVKVRIEKTGNESANYIEKHAKLIQETKYFYTFEYKTRSCDISRTTIDKFELKNNPKLILEA